MKRVKTPVRCFIFSVLTTQVVAMFENRLKTLMVSCTAGDFSGFSKALRSNSPGVILLKYVLS